MTSSETGGDRLQTLAKQRAARAHLSFTDLVDVRFGKRSSPIGRQEGGALRGSRGPQGFDLEPAVRSQAVAALCQTLRTWVPAGSPFGCLDGTHVGA